MTTAAQVIADPMAVNSARNGQAEEKPIAERAVLVKLQVSNWGEQAIDKGATEEVAQSNHVAPGAGKYTKRLLNKAATQQVRDIGRMARNLHNSLTIPWDDNGTRLLPIEAYDKYTTRIDELVEQRRSATNDLIASFPTHIEQSRNELGNLFNQAEYPDPETLRNAFNMSVEFDSVPDTRRFIAAIPEAEREKLRQAIEQRVANRINAGMEDICVRLAKLIKVAHQQMQINEQGEPAARIYDTMVVNLQEMVENIPLINITNDPRLASAAAKLQESINDLHADNLRPGSKHYDAARRDSFKNAVDQMAEQFAGYFV